MNRYRRHSNESKRHTGRAARLAESRSALSFMALAACMVGHMACSHASHPAGVDDRPATADQPAPAEAVGPVVGHPAAAMSAADAATSLPAIPVDAARQPDEGASHATDATDARSHAAELRALILGIPALTTDPAVPESEVLPARLQTERSGNDALDCTYRRYKGTQVFDSLVSFDPNADALWPGSVLQTKSLLVGQLSPIALPRAAGTITLSNATLSAESGYSRVVAAPTHASVQDAIADILGAKQVNLAAKVDFVAEQVYSLNEAAVRVGISADWMTASVRASFDANWHATKTSFIVRFTQAYYTVAFSPPSSPEALFDASVSADDARPYMELGNPPAYVGSVTYGRTLLVRIDSDESASDVRGAIAASLQAGVGAVDAEVAARHRDIMARANVTVFALGGSPDDAVAIMTAGSDRVEKLRAYLAKGANYSATSPGAPISYTVRSLRDNSPIKVASTLDYTIPECSLASIRVGITLGGFRISENNRWLDTSMSYKIWVNDKLEVSGQRTGIGDDSTIVLNEQRILSLGKSHGQPLTIRAELTEGDTTLLFSRTHTYAMQSGSTTGTFNQKGSNTIEQGTGNFSAAFWYAFQEQ